MTSPRALQLSQIIEDDVKGHLEEHIMRPNVLEKRDSANTSRGSSPRAGPYTKKTNSESPAELSRADSFGVCDRISA